MCDFWMSKIRCTNVGGIGFNKKKCKEMCFFLKLVVLFIFDMLKDWVN